MQMLDWFLVIFVLIVAFGTAWFFYAMMENEDDDEQHKGDK